METTSPADVAASFERFAELRDATRYEIAELDRADLASRERRDALTTALRKARLECERYLDLDYFV